MANANTTLRSDIITRLDALDALNHARHMATFLQGVLTLKSNDGLALAPEETTGLYYIIGDITDRIVRASDILGESEASHVI